MVKRCCNLPFIADPSQWQFMTKTNFINPFQQSGTKMTVNFYSTANDFIYKVIEVLLR